MLTVISGEHCAINYRYGGQLIGYHSVGSGQIWLDNVRCNGTETVITDCQHNGWENHDCTHSDDVSVSCTAGIITDRCAYAGFILTSS